MVTIVEVKSKGKSRAKGQKRGQKRTRQGNPVRTVALITAPRATNTPARNPSEYRSMGPMKAALQYMQVMLNPFIWSGVRLGWGCLVESSLAALRVFSTSTVNSDGSFSLAFNNDSARIINGGTPLGMVGYNNGGASTAPSYAYPTFSGQTTLSSLSDATRIIAFGLRSWPSLALTSAPGAVSVTDFPSGNFASSGGLTANQTIALSQTKTWDSKKGASWTWRPTDPDDFVFTPRTYTVGTALPKGSTGIITYTGLPSGTTIYFEAIMHVEYLTGYEQPVDEVRRSLTLPTVAAGGVTPEALHAKFKELPCNCPETPSADTEDLPNLMQHVQRAGYTIGRAGIRAAARYGAGTLDTLFGGMSLKGEL